LPDAQDQVQFCRTVLDVHSSPFSVALRKLRTGIFRIFDTKVSSLQKFIPQSTVSRWWQRASQLCRLRHYSCHLPHAQCLAFLLDSLPCCTIAACRQSKFLGASLPSVDRRNMH